MSFWRILRHIRVMFSTTTGVFMFTAIRNRLRAVNTQMQTTLQLSVYTVHNLKGIIWRESTPSHVVSHCGMLSVGMRKMLCYIEQIAKRQPRPTYIKISCQFTNLVYIGPNAVILKPTDSAQQP